MYKNKNIINKKTRTVDGVKITTEETEVSSFFNSMSVEAGTNGHKGGNKVKGSRTFVKIKNIENTDISIMKDGNSDGAIIKLSGDCELDTFIDALDFMATTLKAQRSRFEKTVDSSKSQATDTTITAKQLGYLRVLLNKHGFELKTTDIPKTDAFELINHIKNNQDNGPVRIPEKYWKYTRKVRKENE